MYSWWFLLLSLSLWIYPILFLLSLSCIACNLVICDTDVEVSKGIDMYRHSYRYSPGITGVLADILNHNCVVYICYVCSTISHGASIFTRYMEALLYLSLVHSQGPLLFEMIEQSIVEHEVWIRVWKQPNSLYFKRKSAINTNICACTHSLT